MSEVMVDLARVVIVLLMFTMKPDSPWMECYAQKTGNTTETSSSSSGTSLNTKSRTTTPPTATSPTTSPPAAEPDPSPYPFIVSIAIDETETGLNVFTHLAAAVILNPNSVISSCRVLMQDKYLNYEVHFMMIVAGTGRVGWGMSKHTQMRELDQIFLHNQCWINSENPDEIDTKYNVALVTLKNPLVVNEYVKPMKLISFNHDILNSLLDEYGVNRVPCNKTTFSMVDHTNWDKDVTAYEDQMTRIIARNVSKWTSSVYLTTFPARLISSGECRSSFCMLSSVGCRHDYAMHKQVCSYPTRIMRKYNNNTAHGNPIVCNGYVFGLWNFILQEFRCSPDVYSNPDCILSLMQDNNIKPPQPHLFSADDARSNQPIFWMGCIQIATHLVHHVLNTRASY